MASKKPKSGPTDEELLAQFDDLATETKESKTKPPSAKPSQSQEEADPLAELENLAQERPKSRPHTPRNIPNPTGPPRHSSDFASGVRTSEDKQQTRKSVESTRTFHQAQTPTENTTAELAKKLQDGVREVQEQVSGEDTSSGGGWWGGLMATASAAVKQAEALAKDLRENEEAQKWAEQVKGNVGVLRSYGEFGVKTTLSDAYRVS